MSIKGEKITCKKVRQFVRDDNLIMLIELYGKSRKTCPMITVMKSANGYVTEYAVKGIEDPLTSLASGKAAEQVKLPARAPRNLNLFIFKNFIAIKLVSKIDKLVIITVAIIVLIPS